MEDLKKKYNRNEDFVFRRIGDETILVPIKNNVGDMGAIYNLNELGAFIWEHLDGNHSSSALKDRILAEFEVSSDVAKRDLLDFLAQLEEIGAVTARKH